MKKLLQQKTKFVPFVLLFFIVFGFRSSDISPYPFTQSSLLWKIEGKKTSYLFGTMHLIEKEYFYFPSKLEKLISKSESIVMELAALPNQYEALQLVTLKEGSFFDYFTAAQTDTILKWAESELKLNETSFRATFSKMKPFMLIQMATQLQLMGKVESYEIKIQQLSSKMHIPLQGLESVQQQMALFDNLNKEEQSSLVMEGIRNKEQSTQSLRKMEALYRRQQVDSLLMLIQSEPGILQEKQKAFVDERNEKWIPKLLSMINSQKCFIAVGAGHLGGINGLIPLLQKEGYTLTPIAL